MTVPRSVFQCSLWTSPNRSRETNTSRLWRSFSFQTLKVFPCKKHDRIRGYDVANKRIYSSHQTQKRTRAPTLWLLFCVALLTSTAKVTQSLSSSFSRAKRSGS